MLNLKVQITNKVLSTVYLEKYMSIWPKQLKLQRMKARKLNGLILIKYHFYNNHQHCVQNSWWAKKMLIKFMVCRIPPNRPWTFPNLYWKYVTVKFLTPYTFIFSTYFIKRNIRVCNPGTTVQSPPQLII